MEIDGWILTGFILIIQTAQAQQKLLEKEMAELTNAIANPGVCKVWISQYWWY